MESLCERFVGKRLGLRKTGEMDIKETIQVAFDSLKKQLKDGERKENAGG